MKSILLVEDDETLGISLEERLAKEGYRITWTKNLRDARSADEKSTYDLYIVDIGLPDGSGFNFAKEIKGKASLPVIFLTAMNSAEYRLEGFEIGADDYIPKPFHLKELLLRIAKVLDTRSAPSAIRSGDVTINVESMSIKLPSGKVEFLIQRDFELLKFLVETSPKIVSRQDVINGLWRAEENTTPRTVDNSIVRLRAHLGELGESYIRSVRGVGYQWVAR